MTDEVTEIPRCCSRRIQSEVAWRVALRPLTVPAIWIAPPNSSSFSVSVVLPASGWEMIANVRLRAISRVNSGLEAFNARLQRGVGEARRRLHGPRRPDNSRGARRPARIPATGRVGLRPYWKAAPRGTPLAFRRIAPGRAGRA